MFSAMSLRWLGVPALAAAMLVFGDTPKADAQGFSLQIGRFGVSNYGHSSYRNYGGYRSYRPSYHVGTPIYSSRYRSGYRAYNSVQPHYDYHAPSLVPHGNHLDYVPGHYDLHYGSHHGHFGH